jgi:hypothetical protein
MIGTTDRADAVREALRSIGKTTVLEIWNGTEYVDC